jgi:nucleotide-binding universal stress UspA family protein
MRILVPSDGSEHCEHVIRHAIQFAKHLDNPEVRVLYVIDTTELEEFSRIDAIILEKNGYSPSRIFEIFDPKKISKVLNKKAEITLTHIKREIETTPQILGSTKVEFGIRRGEPSKEILKECKSYNADLIIMGSLRIGSRLAIGSTADKVIRGAKVPVMVIGPKSKFCDITKILVPVDMSDISKVSLRLAAYFARKLGVSLKLFHVVNESVVRYLSSLSGLSGDEKERLISEYSSAAKEYLKKLSNMDELKDVKVETVVTKGDPTKEILRELNKGKCQMVVMSTRGMGHLGRFLIGSVTGGVISQANRPVVVVKA